MTESVRINDPGMPTVLAFRRHTETGVLLQAGKNIVVLSESELLRLAEFLATTPAPASVSPVKARFSDE